MNFVEIKNNFDFKEPKNLLVLLLIIIVSILGLKFMLMEEEADKQELEARVNFNNNSTTEEIKRIGYESYKEWEKLLEGYKVDAAGRLLEVPEVKIVKLPNDIDTIEDIEKRKRIFFNIIAIGAYHANQNILAQRDILYQVSNQYLTLGYLREKSKDWVQNKAKVYGIDTEQSWEVMIQKLQKRLDIVPLSLILAQAASESGWGTSRFSLKANNIFGEWTFDAEEEGIIPAQRPAGANYKIRKFASVEAAIESYLLNLNSYYAYDKFREIRYELRQKGKKLAPLKLSAGLIKYSTGREEYVTQINSIIKYNDLEKFDRLLRK